MSLLINAEIEEMLGDAVIIDPYHADQLNTNSYDLCLGNFFWRPKVADGPIRPSRDLQEYTLEDAATRGYIRLLPGEFVLAHSLEFAGGRVRRWGSYPHAVTSFLSSTSTARRTGFEVCSCAGLGDVGYVNRWTFEIVNDSPNVQELEVGSIIAQISFELVEAPDADTLYGAGRVRDGLKGLSSNLTRARDSYQTETDLAAVQAAWRPEMMLPKRIKVKEWARRATGCAE